MIPYSYFNFAKGSSLELHFNLDWIIQYMLPEKVLTIST